MGDNRVAVGTRQWDSSRDTITPLTAPRPPGVLQGEHLFLPCSASLDAPWVRFRLISFSIFLLASASQDLKGKMLLLVNLAQIRKE